MKKHKHAELIKAWADGAEIECLYGGQHWRVIEQPKWHIDAEYRIKPQDNLIQESTKMMILLNKHAHRYEVFIAGSYYHRDSFNLVGYFEVSK